MPTSYFLQLPFESPLPSMEARGVLTNKKSSEKSKPWSPVRDLSGQIRIGLQNPNHGERLALTHNLYQMASRWLSCYIPYTKALSNENGVSVSAKSQGFDQEHLYFIRMPDYLLHPGRALFSKISYMGLWQYLCVHMFFNLEGSKG